MAAHLDPVTKDPINPPPPDEAAISDADTDTDSLLAQLESELELSGNPSTSPTTTSLLSARKAELESQSQSQSQTPQRRIIPTSHFTGLQTPSSEESLIKSTADAAAAVVVFYSASFRSSVRMRDLVSTLADEYSLRGSGSSMRDADSDGVGETLFFAAEAEKCEWLCRRLMIRVLPVVVGYVDGREVGRVVGFEGIRGGEDAGWQALGSVLGSWGGSWNGTMGKGSGGSVLGDRWAEWIGGVVDVENARGDGSDEESDEGEKERRRRTGFIGGGRTNHRTKIGGRTRRTDVGDDEDDDWD